MSRHFAVFAALIGHWRRRPLQLLALLGGLAIATALWSGVQALNAQARGSYDRAAALLGGEAVERLHRVDGERFALADFATLRRAGWPVSPMREGRIEIGDRSLRVIGVEPLSLPARSGFAAATARSDDTNALERFLAPPWLGLVAAETLQALDTKDLPEAMPPLEAAESIAPGVLVTDIGVAERLLGATGRIDSFLLDGDARHPARDPSELLGVGVERSAEGGGDGELSRLTESFHLNLTAFGMLAFLVGLFIVYSTISLAFEQRLPTMRTLRACGVSGRGLTAALAAEVLCAALLAGALGVAAGYGIAALLMPDVAASLAGLYGARVSGTLSMEPSWWVQGLAMSLLGAFAAAATGLFRAYRMPPLATAQRSAWRESQQRLLRWQGVAAMLLLTAFAGFAVLGDSLLSGFGALAALLLGGALLLPPALAALLRGGESRSRSALSVWFWADTRQQLSGLSMALMALLLALSANIGVGTMVDGFRETFTGWLDRRLVAEIYLNAEDDAQAAALESWMRGRSEIEAVLPTLRPRTRLEGWPVTVVGFVDHTTYRDHWPLIAETADVWDRVAAGTAVLVSEQLAQRLELRPGDAVALGDWRPVVAAIYPDYGNPRGQISAAFDAVARQFPDAPRGGYGLRVAHEDVDAVMSDLRSDFALTERQMIDQAALKRFSTGIFEKTFAVTAALNVLTLLVAGVAMFMSLLTLAEMRLPQVAPVWSSGVTRERLAVLELGKSAALALMTALLSIPLGLALAWCLVAVVNVQAFGWRLPLHLFPEKWALTVLLAVTTASLAALLPALQLYRIEPARLLRIFANER